MYAQANAAAAKSGACREAARAREEEAAKGAAELKAARDGWERERVLWEEERELERSKWGQEREEERSAWEEKTSKIEEKLRMEQDAWDAKFAQMEQEGKMHMEALSQERDGERDKWQEKYAELEKALSNERVGRASWEERCLSLKHTARTPTPLPDLTTRG